MDLCPRFQDPRNGEILGFPRLHAEYKELQGSHIGDLALPHEDERRGSVPYYHGGIQPLNKEQQVLP